MRSFAKSASRNGEGLGRSMLIDEGNPDWRDLYDAIL
jgi:hypothetical protein